MTRLLMYKSFAVFFLLITFSTSVYAVFEGRNEQVQEYTTIRQQVDIAPLGSKATEGTPSGLGGLGNVGDSQPFMAPIEDNVLWYVLLLCGLGCGAYGFLTKRNAKGT